MRSQQWPSGCAVRSYSMVIMGLNSEVLKKVVRTLGLQTMIDKTALDLVPTIQPVLIANPDKNSEIVRTTASSSTLYTAPSSKKRFFLTGAHISSCSNNQNTTVLDAINIIPKIGPAVNVCDNRLGSQLASTVCNSVTAGILFPIELKPGSAISATIQSSAGAATIIGYEEDIL
jgi:hypothetical protein